MMTLHLFNRWSFRSTLSMPSSLRVEVRPPSLRHAPDSAWHRVMCWLLAPNASRAAPPLNRLSGVRDDFVVALADVDTDEGRELAGRIDKARSLRELWHLRSDVYRVVSLRYSQHEADERLADLNRHFPTRAPRSGFAPL